MSNSMVSSYTVTLYDDDSVREKLLVMDKIDAIMDDDRNPSPYWDGSINEFLELGKTYKITLTIEEV